MGIENQHINPFLQDRENANRERREANKKLNGSSTLGRFARKAAAVGAMFGGLMAQEGLASQKKIAEAQKQVDQAELVVTALQARYGLSDADLDLGSKGNLENFRKLPKKAQSEFMKAWQKVADAKGNLGIAKGEDADEKGAKIAPKQEADISRVGAAENNVAKKDFTHRLIVIKHPDGSTETYEDGSKKWLDYKVKMEKAGRPIIAYNPGIDGYSVYNGGPGWYSNGMGPGGAPFVSDGPLPYHGVATDGGPARGGNFVYGRGGRQ